jgi:protein-tyrosine-phosphatase
MALWLRFLEWLHSLWPEVVAGVITAGVLASLGYLYAKTRTIVGRNRKVLVYVSSGGTCRDPMAKAITQQLLAGQKLKYPIDIYAVGLNPIENGPTFAARQTIKDMYRRDLLKDHKPTRFTADLVNKADLILVMDNTLFEATKNTLPSEKTHVLKDFFGLKGNVDDPYHSMGQKDPKTLARYRACADELKQIISENMDKLLKGLGEA